MRKLFVLAILLCTVLSSGCALTSEALNTANVAAEGNERYHVLAQKALDGKAVAATDHIHPVTKDEWSSTPKSVRVLVDRLLNGLGVNRLAFYSIKFQLDGGADPATLDLKPVLVPEVEAPAEAPRTGVGE